MFEDAIRAIGAADPSAVAIAEAGRELSYGRLHALVESSSDLLRSAGLSAGDVVVLRARRETHLPVALLSIWRLGACAALVDGALPAARLAECEEVVQPEWRLTTRDGLELVRLNGPRAESRVDPPANGSHILFTSGTTGRPAAVEVGPKALQAALSWYVETFRPLRTDRVALLSGPGHDPVLRDMFIPLTSGGTLVVPPPDVFASPNRLLSFVDNARITVLHCTPALLELLIAAHGGPYDRRLAGLRLVMSAGAPLLFGAVRGLCRAADNAVVVNAYGSTETPQIASCEVVTREWIDRNAHLPDNAAIGIGSGAGDSELLIGDPYGGFDAATAGEIIVRSPNLARRYVAGTGPSHRFIDDPYGAAGYRAYRSGDLGERGADGGIRVLGRLDRQMSINGFRIAPEEIERAALRNPAVAQAAAGPIDGPAGQLIALSVVPRVPDALDGRSLRDFLRPMLPGHALPARIEVVPALRLNANHKVAGRHDAQPSCGAKTRRDDFPGPCHNSR